MVGVATDTRHEERLAFTERLTYRYGERYAGSALWHDVSRSGGRVHLGRYLRPGKSLLLTFGASAQFSAMVVWCRRAGNSADFEAGLWIPRNGEESVLHYTALAEEFAPEDGPATCVV